MNRILLRYIQRHCDAVSFDVFDTLIERDVFAPEDIFRLAGGDVLGDGGAEEFLRRRKAAERTARTGRPNGEVTLPEIYQALAADYGPRCQALMDAEIGRELASCRAKEGMAALLRACAGCGKDVYLITDMYLPSAVIARMLERCGVGPYRQMYVSGECGVNKRDGALFRRVIAEHAIDPGRMLHIGDSLAGDILGARKASVRALPTGRKNRWRRKLRTLAGR